MIVGVVKEGFQGEQRVALVPAHVDGLRKAGFEIWVQKGAGEAAGYPDEGYRNRGCRLVESREEILRGVDVLLAVRAAGANPTTGREDAKALKEGCLVIGQLDPYTPDDSFDTLATRKASACALELLPRITRAQSMDVLSSMANLSGYKAVILAAEALPRLFPMMMTAAGTLVPAKVFVIGAGVAGLQALATARRLGAVTSAYDVRPAVKEQVESLGARFIELGLESKEAETIGGYARAMDEEFYRRQREKLGEVIAGMDVVITTASVPGKKAPVLITREMVEQMAPGSVIVDIAAERGGNCELTKPGERYTYKGVMIIGPVNLASTVPFHASQLYSKNITTFLLSIVKNGSVELSEEDEVVKSVLVMRQGSFLNDLIKPK
ncbi:MAG: Re/Si-specific NAD(P)(+) transhydrogenase subunit alpha [Spirochaetes bacterium]|nr:Re/Si-specific NAD(P)(+) transhydrogenase subunit alpha [Spirochaetota bacterium]